MKGLSPLKKGKIALQIYPFLGLFSLYFHVALCKAIKFGWKLSENKMFQEQNYENALTLNILWLNISCDIDINGFGRNSVRDMGTFRNCDVERFEIQTGDIKTP